MIEAAALISLAQPLMIVTRRPSSKTGASRATAARA